MCRGQIVESRRIEFSDGYMPLASLFSAF